MSIKKKLVHILAELKGHAPFTTMGAITGIVFMLIFQGISKSNGRVLFSIFHPGHVLLSAMVTASIFTLHRQKKNFILVLIIGYVGSIGIATLSDSVIPYLGERLFDLHIPTHADLHSTGEHAEDIESEEHHEHSEVCGHEHHGDGHGIHLGFIENWYIVNPAAILGVLIAYFIPRTKFPHAGHVLMSTWASSSHILMNTAGEITLVRMAGIFGILFVAVWLPCCISDIVFPLLFVKSDVELDEECLCHGLHSHGHHKKGGDGEN